MSLSCVREPGRGDLSNLAILSTRDSRDIYFFSFRMAIARESCAHSKRDMAFSNSGFVGFRDGGE